MDLHENRVKEFAPCLDIFSPKVNDIKIERNIRLFFPLLIYSPFIVLLSLFFSLLHGLEAALGVGKSRCIWVIWCKLLTQFSQIQSYISFVCEYNYCQTDNTCSVHRGRNRIFLSRGCICFIINHIVFWQNISHMRKLLVILGGWGGAHPLYPPPRSRYGTSHRQWRG